MDANLHIEIEPEHAVTSFQCVFVLVCWQMWTDVKWSRCACVGVCMHICVCLNMIKYIT